jgi:hypothetical protein
MFETVKTTEASVSSANVARATGVTSAVLGNSEYGVSLSDERHADIDSWVPSPLIETWASNTSEVIVAPSDEQSPLLRFSSLQPAECLDQEASQPLSNPSTAAASDSNHESHIHTPWPADDDFHSDLDPMTGLFKHGNQTHLQGDEQMAAVSFRQAFEQMTIIKPQN